MMVAKVMMRMKTNRRILGIALIVVFLLTLSLGGYTQDTWLTYFEGDEYGALLDVALVGESDFIAVGATNHRHFPPLISDALAMRVGLDGTVVWERTWGGTGFEQAHAIAPTTDGNLIIFGETTSIGAGDRDFTLQKITPDGEELWTHTYGTAFMEKPFGMTGLGNGDVLIYGLTTSPAGRREAQYAVRVDGDGSVLWEHTAETAEEELIIDAIETQDGAIVLSVVINGMDDGMLVKLDAAGDEIWSVRYELENHQYAASIAQTDDGFLLAGFELPASGIRQADVWLARTTSEGDLLWEKTFGDPHSDDYAVRLLRLADGDYLIGGLGERIALFKITESGDVVWEQRLGTAGGHIAYSLTELPDGGFLVSGMKTLINGRSYDIVLMRTDALGQTSSQDP
ncbi:MAG: hypothetical protein E4H08_06215 [Candidatus Atribacteria bacterium]|nr:MAG: hypothetical protein E4H08_06215 [Candidatus Atribacteria bacterium]